MGCYGAELFPLYPQNCTAVGSQDRKVKHAGTVSSVERAEVRDTPQHCETLGSVPSVTGKKKEGNKIQIDSTFKVMSCFSCAVVEVCWNLRSVQ